MVRSEARAEIGIFEGTETVSIVRLRTNKKTGRLEYKSNGMFTAWHPIDGKGIPIQNVGPEKFLLEDGIRTKIRAVRFKQAIDGTECAEDVNPRFAHQIEVLKMENVRLHKLARAYYDTLTGMVGKDKFKELMKDTFKAVKEAKDEGQSFSQYDPYNRFGGSGLNRMQPSLGMQRSQ